MIWASMTCYSSSACYWRNVSTRAPASATGAAAAAGAGGATTGAGHGGGPHNFHFLVALLLVGSLLLAPLPDDSESLE